MLITAWIFKCYYFALIDNGAEDVRGMRSEGRELPHLLRNPLAKKVASTGEERLRMWPLPPRKMADSQQLDLGQPPLDKQLTVTRPADATGQLMEM